MRINAGQKCRDISGETYLMEGVCTDVKTGMKMVLFRLFPLTLNEELYRQIFVLPYEDFFAEADPIFGGQKYAFELIEDE